MTPRRGRPIAIIRQRRGYQRSAHRNIERCDIGMHRALLLASGQKVPNCFQDPAFSLYRRIVGERLCATQWQRHELIRQLQAFLQVRLDGVCAGQPFDLDPGQGLQ